jgi:hypothetical protein
MSLALSNLHELLRKLDNIALAANAFFTILSINMFKLTLNFEHVTFKAPHSCWYLRTADDLYIQNWKGPVGMTVDRTFPTLVPMNGKVLLKYFKLHSVKIFGFLPYQLYEELQQKVILYCITSNILGTNW